MNLENFFKEKKNLAILSIFFLVVLTIFIIIYFETKSEYKYEQEEYLIQIGFFEDYLTKFTELDEKIISEMVGGLLFLYKEIPEIIDKVSAIELLAIGIVETNFKNIKGDNGNSLGYFQIQAPTYWYLKYEYLDIYENIDFLLPWYWDNIEGRADVQIITAALYLYDLKIRYGEEMAYSMYNGGSETYGDKITYTMSWLNVKYDQYTSSRNTFQGEIIPEKAF